MVANNKIDYYIHIFYAFMMNLPFFVQYCYAMWLVCGIFQILANLQKNVAIYLLKNIHI